MPLTNKLVLAFLLVTMVPLGMIIGVLHYTFVKHAERQVGTRLEDSVIQVGKSMNEFMFSCVRGVKDLAEDSELSSGDSDVIHLQLSRYIRSFPFFTEIMLVDVHGVVIASSSAPEVGTSLFTRFENTRDEFEQALHRAPGYVYINDLSVMSGSLRPLVAASKLRDVNLGIQMLTAVRDAAPKGRRARRQHRDRPLARFAERPQTKCPGRWVRLVAGWRGLDPDDHRSAGAFTLYAS